MAGDPAELAYGHALAMLGDPHTAAEVAALALQRAGRDRIQVLAHARHHAVARAAADEPVDIGSLPAVMLDLPALAATLASTRTAQERAALDLRARTGGDLAALGDALGMRPSAAADKCAEIAELWERTLDPALVAFSGPGECQALAAILDDAGGETVAELLEVGPAVRAHCDGCTVCADRVRAMASVRSFFGDVVVEVPAAVREASTRHRTKRPSAAPAPLFGASRPARHRFGIAAGLAAAVFFVVGAAVLRSRDASNAPRALTKVAAATGLRLEGDPTSGLHLVNGSGRTVRYTVSASAPWLRLAPAAGRMTPGGSVALHATLTEDAPEGEIPASVVVHTSSGATTSRSFTWRNERAPELATTLEGCSVALSVIDDGDLASLQLHWRDTAEHVLDITGDDDAFNAELRPDNGPVTYWATATDTRGNTARSADGVIEPGAC